MTSKAALCLALLEGKVVNIKTGFENFGITNIPREIGRSVEREFDVLCIRVDRTGSSRYGQPCVWVDYRLNKASHNKEGIQKMKEYVQEQLKTMDVPKTNAEARFYKQTQLFLDTL